MIMRCARLHKVMAMAISLSAILSLYGCPAGMGPYVPPPVPGGSVQPQPAVIGTIEALQGTGVSAGGRSAYVNMPVHPGEEVRTGPGSTAIIRFSRGGFMRIDANTDPIFSLIKQGVCIFIKMFYGHAQLDSEGQCVEMETPESYAFINSKVDISIASGRTVFSVLEGRVAVNALDVHKLRPREAMPVPAGQLVVVTRARVESIRPMTPAELQQLQRGFYRTRETPAPIRPPVTTPPVKPPTMTPPVTTAPPTMTPPVTPPTKVLKPPVATAPLKILQPPATPAPTTPPLR